MDQMNIVKRAWKILWSYRALWVFGILVALTSSGGSGGSGGSNSGWRFDSRDMDLELGEFGRWLEQMGRQIESFFTPERLGAVVGIAIALICLAVIVGIFFAMLRYVGQVALIRMVDQYEVTGEKLPWRQGWRLGWSRSAWRLFLINLVISLPVMLVVAVLLGTAVLPVGIAALRGTEPGAGAIVATIGMVFMMILVLLLIGVAVSLFSEIIYRVCVLQDRGPIDSIRAGWNLVKRNFKDVFLMWLLLVGISVALLVVFIPITILLLVLGLAFGGGLGAGLFFLLRSLADQTTGIITAAIAGGGLFLLVLVLPLTFLGGLRETFFSTSWTLAYRELDRLGELETPVITPPALPEQPAAI